MYHASSSADENINMSMGLGGQDGGNGMFNDASSTEADGEFILMIFLRKGTIFNFLKLSQPFFWNVDCLVPLTTVSRRGIPESCLSNKLNRLTLATFDDEGT